jgi:hypothetical protein
MYLCVYHKKSRAAYINWKNEFTVSKIMMPFSFYASDGSLTEGVGSKELDLAPF